MLMSLGELARRHELLENLVLRDIRSRYKQTVLGIVWALLTPIATTILFVLVFDLILKVNTGRIPYPLFVLCGLLVWNFFSTAVSASVGSLVGNMSIVTKVYFPREMFPLAAVLSKLVDLALGAVVFAGLLIVYDLMGTGIAPGISLVWLPTILLVQIAFTTGLSLLLATANLFLRDVQHLIGLALMLWMYVSPVIYPLDRVPEAWRGLYLLNPMAGLIDAYRRVILLAEWPDWPSFAGATLVSLILLVVGYLVFKRFEPRFADII